VLLQAYISQLKLEGFALMADMVYVTQVHQNPALLKLYIYIYIYTHILVTKINIFVLEMKLSIDEIIFPYFVPCRVLEG